MWKGAEVCENDVEFAVIISSTEISVTGIVDPYIFLTMLMIW